MPYEIRWNDEARAEALLLPAYHVRPIFTAIALLQHQASVETRNRKPLSEPIEGLPPGTWEIRAGAYRALYWIEEEKTAHILRVIFKGTSTLAEALARGEKP